MGQDLEGQDPLRQTPGEVQTGPGLPTYQATRLADRRVLSLRPVGRKILEGVLIQGVQNPAVVAEKGGAKDIFRIGHAFHRLHQLAHGWGDFCCA